MTEEKRTKLEKQKTTILKPLKNIFELETHISQLKNEKQNIIDQIGSKSLKIEQLEKENSSINKKMTSDLAQVPN